MELGNLSQLEIEQEFDRSKVREAISNEIIEYAETIEEYESDIYDIMTRYVTDIDQGDTKEIVLILLAMLGNEKAGIILGEDRQGKIKPLSSGMKKINARDIPFNVFIKTFYKDRFIKETFQHHALDFAMDIAVGLDGIFFDIVKRVEMVNDGQFRTLTYIRSELLFEEDVSLRAHYERFRLPLIEKPHHWTEQSKGGYHLNKSRCITNKGNENQSQNILDVLNKLQDQPFKHSQNLEAELEFLINKFKKDGNSDKMSVDKANAIILTCEETYNAIGDRDIYFEWKYDSRGRFYSTGYDINIQGNKAKKGGLRPKLW